MITEAEKLKGMPVTCNGANVLCGACHHNGPHPYWDFCSKQICGKAKGQRCTCVPEEVITIVQSLESELK